MQQKFKGTSDLRQIVILRETMRIRFRIYSIYIYEYIYEYAVLNAYFSIPYYHKFCMICGFYKNTIVFFVLEFLKILFNLIFLSVYLIYTSAKPFSVPKNDSTISRTLSENYKTVWSFESDPRGVALIVR